MNDEHRMADAMDLSFPMPVNGGTVKAASTDAGRTPGGVAPTDDVVPTSGVAPTGTATSNASDGSGMTADAATPAYTSATAEADRQADMPSSLDAPHLTSPTLPPIVRANRGDIVDTAWDIPSVEFPEPEPEPAPKDGPRHAPAKGAYSTAQLRRMQQNSAETTTRAIPLSEVAGERTEVMGGDAPTAVLSGDTSASATAVIPDSGSTAATAVFPGGDVLSSTRLFPGSMDPTSSRTAQSRDERLSGLEFSTMPPAIAHRLPDEVPQPPEEPRKRSKTPVIIGVIVAIAVVAAAIAGVLVWRNGQSEADHASALAACTKSSSEANDARAALDAALKDAQDASALTADQVADSATLDTLKQAIEDADALDEVAACGADLSAADLDAHARSNGTLAEQFTSAADDVTKAAKAVTDSRDAKTASDTKAAQDDLQTAVAEAQTLLDNSLWAVADNTTRVALEQAIDIANTALQSGDADLKTLEDAQEELQRAVDGVNESMEELAAINAGQQAPSQYQQYTYGNNGYGTYDPYGTGAVTGGPSTQQSDRETDETDTDPEQTGPGSEPTPSAEPNPTSNSDQQAETN